MNDPLWINNTQDKSIQAEENPRQKRDSDNLI
jgi:hypothetical protein